MDESFYRRYEAALDGLSDESIAQVARLSSERLKTWVESPPAIRPHLLARWASEKSVTQHLDESAERAAEALEDHLARLNASTLAHPARIPVAGFFIDPIGWIREGHAGSRVKVILVVLLGLAISYGVWLILPE